MQVRECLCVVKRGTAECPHRASEQSCSLRSQSAYFNAGLIVLRPCRMVCSHMQSVLSTLDLASFPFAEQDFLNAYWQGAWDPLPWVYNATKGLFACHRDDLWDFSQVKLMHFTMAKPWDLKHPCHKGFERLNELWWSAFSEPASLFHTLLRLHRSEKQRKQRQKNQKASIDLDACSMDGASTSRKLEEHIVT